MTPLGHKVLDNPVMARAAGQVETKHQQIHDLQLKLQKQLPALATHWSVNEFNTFQRDYSQFDSEFERVKQGLDMVHASLTGQAEVPIPPARRGRGQVNARRAHPSHGAPKARRARSEAPQHGHPAPLPDGVAGLADANAELNTLLATLHSELVVSMAEWTDAARHAWDTAQTSWDESNHRQQDIVANLPEAMARAHGTDRVWFPTTPAAS